MQKVHFITQGCSANVADSEVMQGILSSDYELVDSPDKADVVVFNTCTVKGPTESAFKKKLKELESQNKKVIIAGCIPQGQPNILKDHSRIGTYQIKNIKKVVDETLQGNTVALLDRTDEGRLNTPKVRRNQVIEIVPILQGCLNSCTFCKTKHARGTANSYPIQDIVRHISKAVEEGAKEIWLTSQDNAVYGLEFNSNLAELLKSIVSIDRDFKIRLGMGNPKYMMPYVDELIEVMKNQKVFKFIHIPLQSGSNTILDAMRREYKAADFVRLVNKFREAIPGISIMTDIICGFPGETDKDFEETLRILEETKPDMVNVSRFWMRPGTPAALMKQVDGAVAMERCKQTMVVFKFLAYDHNKQFVGTTDTILITEKGKNGTFIGKNNAYKQVILTGNFEIGQEVKVKIIDATSLDLRGVVV